MRLLKNFKRNTTKIIKDEIQAYNNMSAKERADMWKGLALITLTVVTTTALIWLALNGYLVEYHGH